MTPTGLTVTSVTPTSLTLFWTGSLDNVGVVGYAVYNGVVVAGSTAVTSYTVLGLSCGTPYTLAVDAYDAAGNHSAKTSVSATTDACSDTSPPTTPTNLAVSGTTASSITVSWSASSDTAP